MCKLEVLVSKLLSIDTLASRSIAPCEVTSLAHEAGDDPVERASLEAKPFFSCAQGPEVFGCGGYNITP